MTNTNRRKGHNAERLYAQLFREIGYEQCKTTRESSRLLDNCKVDLDFLPIFVQVKAGRQKDFNPSKILFTMEEELLKAYPDDLKFTSKPKVVIHHKQGASGRQRNEYDNLVIMTFETFKIFLKNYEQNTRK